MKTGVRVIKGGRADGLRSLQHGGVEQTGPQREREIAGTVKGWIAESARRRRADEQSAAQIVAAIHRDAYNRHAP